MNFWAEPLPKTVTIDGKEYPIYTDFRVWIQCGILLEQDTHPLVLASKLLSLCYPALPPSFEGAIKGIVSFYSGSDEIKGDGAKIKLNYSFIHDAELIYAAFYSQYGIDLTTVSLHWYQFRALFMGLDSNSRFAEAMEAREVILSKISDPEQKAYYRKLKAKYRLPGEVDTAEGLEVLF
ncbi:MAG: hypothetical protein E7399_03050 [Ruminococcaceae bacterium]|nr:hypothetical protein [Oscillospiraceae bacterium]